MQALVTRQPFKAAVAAPARSVVVRRPVAVVAAKPTKASEFRSLSDDEIVEKIGDLKTELASVRFLQRTRGVSEFPPGELPQPDPEKTPKAHLNKFVRRQIAQLKTVLRERSLAAGVSTREYRKAEARSTLGLFPKPARQ